MQLANCVQVVTSEMLAQPERQAPAALSQEHWLSALHVSCVVQRNAQISWQLAPFQVHMGFATHVADREIRSQRSLQIAEDASHMQDEGAATH
jgi:hypothetical protein